MILSMLAPPGVPNPEGLIKFYTEKKAMNYVMIQNGVVINIVDWDGITPYNAPDDCQLHSWQDAVDIGWLWVDGAPVNPNPPIESTPEPITPPESTGPTVL